MLHGPCFVWTRWELIQGSRCLAHGQDIVAPHLEVPIDDGYDPVPQRFLTMELTEGGRIPGWDGAQENIVYVSNYYNYQTYIYIYMYVCMYVSKYVCM